MINNKKVIGLCITRIYQTARGDLVDRLHRRLEKAGMKLIVFNSFLDFYHNNAFDDGARSIYDVIQFDVIDALVIHAGSFHDKTIVHSLADRAKAASVPVVMIGEQAEGCFCIENEYREAYCHVLRHVIKDHGVTDTVFMAGRRQDDPSTVGRLSCYRQVLEECGIPYEESRVYYGEYWDVPTVKALNQMLTDMGRVPEAIFCANDTMAYAVCDWARERGLKVPGDLIVTGYDRLPFSELSLPELTTCSDNPSGMADLLMEAIMEGLDTRPPRVLMNHHIAIINESCGCERRYQGDYREFAKERHQTVKDMEDHETHQFVWLERILNIGDMNGLYNTISGAILPNSYMCLRADYLVSSIDEKRTRRGYRAEDELLVIPSSYNFDQAEHNSTITVGQMIPFDTRWAEGNTMYVLCAVYVKDDICGYYAAETESIKHSMHHLKRVQNTLNLAFNISVNHFKQQNLRRTVERAAQSNPVTGLPNMRGAVEWYNSFMEEHPKEYWISVSMYAMPKYSYIAETYGVDDSEEVQRFVAECLKMANPKDCFIAHIAEDSFMVLNYYPSHDEVDPTINRATSSFYSQIEGFNSSSSKDYYIEVNAGCTVLEPDMVSTLESLIKFANSDLYMNRLKLGMGKVVKEEESPKEHYRAFEMLLNKNMFIYHFQPIIDARTGEIFGYEALMRTDDSIGLNPLQILAAAKEYGKLYDIERATLFNVMSHVAGRANEFGDKKVFINTIPGHFLNDEDLNKLIDTHGQQMGRYFFELTEQETMSDRDLESLRRLGDSAGTSQIAIDDFGTGHSNIVNLLRYQPQVIKIDRYLVQEICKDQNKQLFVRNVVEFANLNGILTLAEGVETSNELHTLIDLGVDLIQGYYTGRPQPNPINELPEHILRDIRMANPNR